MTELGKTKVIPEILFFFFLRININNLYYHCYYFTGAIICYKYKGYYRVYRGNVEGKMRTKILPNLWIACNQLR